MLAVSFTPDVQGRHPAPVESVFGRQVVSGLSRTKEFL